MGKKFNELTSEHKKFIVEQKMFFVGTAAESGRVNISPKGVDSFRVIDSNKVVWLNLTGSGNETAAHLSLNNRMTIMFCAFEGKPLILRLYGQAKIYHPRDKEFEEYISLFDETPGSRQIIVMDVDLVQNSCGFGVPIMEFKEDRSLITDWVIKRGKDGLTEYWKEKNQTSIDGFETHILNN
ncbi:pyridoxamine 5'-phosphate oxidase family protein [Fulvivirga lutea]|uniref:Pyridoxamine 5'-phosphate oxidase family protein n=1 Tax=Fulvivirga lutea TaxID=2810512 RepID=A0A974WF31_9BACT|nr:pyridoxamine 5'-phosphate oxidase family protein [Fulvivirga lutea]QSE97021.1 pyridoxamine 5'-phosphate oxidase family protein [Fulvivirga lutea]